MKLFGTMEVINNELHIGGKSTVALAKEFGTPLFVLDETLIRDKCREYMTYFKTKEYGNKVSYAGKSFLTIAICELIKEEGLCLDVVSGGELYTAIKSNFPMENIYFHGNNKTEEEIYMGVENGIGTFVADNFYEIDKINEISKKLNKVQKVMLRITPGIEAHTHDYIKTGHVDSKFGFTILNNKTMTAVKKVISLSNIELTGLHCHIGSQIFEIEPYLDAVSIMMFLIKNIKDELNYEIQELNLGGGFGIYYNKNDDPKEPKEFCTKILEKAVDTANSLKINLPRLIIEPGRSIVGNAGITLYTVGSIKNIPNIRKYVAIDGGMTDNIRPALYDAEYECTIANRVKSNWKELITISGKCCESGDILLSNVELPETYSGDILAMLSTGAYCYAMSSNYNKVPRPPVVLVKEKVYKLICRRETYEDILSRELPLY